MSSFYYLYCLKDKTKRKFVLKGIDKNKIYTLSYKNIEAVITEVNPKEFNPKRIKSKLEDPKWTEEKVRNHENVIEEAMKAGTHEVGAVIPLKFLTLYKSKVSLNNILKKKYKDFRRLLNKFREKAEWGLKVFLVDREKFIETIKKEDEEIAKIKAETSLKSEGVKYFLEKQIEEKISVKVDEQLDKYIKDIYEIFSPFSTEKPVINKLLPAELTDRGKEMILNVSYLIPQEKVGEFQGTVRRLHEYYSSKGLWLEYTGPWPPYSFIDYGDKNKKSS